MITESAIKAALRKVGAGEKGRLELRDDGERSAGRLALIVRSLGTRTPAEFYAVWHRDGKRVMAKLGSYPTLSLADARKRFREEFAPAISAGAEPATEAARRRHRKEAGTVAELFTAYVAHLKAAGKRSADRVEQILLGAAHAIGVDRAASEVGPGNVTSYLSDIYDRGAAVMAVTARAYLSAAFNFGMKAEHDYRRKSPGPARGIKSNPGAAIPADTSASKPGRHP